MNEAANSTGGFWLMTGDVPSGPFDAAQIHAKLAAGEASWQTLACPVGGGTWLPLVRVPGIGPVPPPPPPAPHGMPATSVAPPGAVPAPALAADRAGGSDLRAVGTQDRARSDAPPPFRFRSGGEARTVDELVALCEGHWDDAEWHLTNGDLEAWFRRAAWDSLAAKAEKARKCGWMARQALIYVLKQCGESGRALASRAEAEDAARRQQAKGEAQRRNEENEGAGKGAASASAAGCPKCGKADRLRNGYCYHCGHSSRPSAAAASPPAMCLACACGRKLEVSPEQAGLPVQCPSCDRVVATPVGKARLGPDPANAPLSPQAKLILGIAGAIGGGILGSFALVVDSAGNSSGAGCFGILFGAAAGACWASSGFKPPHMWGK